MPSNIPKKYQEIDQANHHLQTSPPHCVGFRGSGRSSEKMAATDGQHTHTPPYGGDARAPLPSRTHPRHRLSVLYRPPRPCRSEAAGAGRRLRRCIRRRRRRRRHTPARALRGAARRDRRRENLPGGIEIPRRESGERRRATNLEERGRSFGFCFDFFLGG